MHFETDPFHRPVPVRRPAPATKGAAARVHKGATDPDAAVASQRLALVKHKRRDAHIAPLSGQHRQLPGAEHVAVVRRIRARVMHRTVRLPPIEALEDPSLGCCHLRFMNYVQIFYGILGGAGLS